MEPTLDVQGTIDQAVNEPISGDTPGGMSVMSQGGMTAAPPEPTLTWDSAVVSSEPARDVVEQNETFIAESEPTPVTREDTPLFQEQDLTDEEAAYLAGEDQTDDEIEAQRIQDEIDADKEQIYADLNDLYKRSDDIAREQIDAIQAQYKLLANESREISRRREAALNVMGFRSGRARYAPEIQSGIIATEQRALVTQLGKLALMEQQAISEAKAAQAERDFQIAATKIDFAKELRKEKQDTLDKLRQKIEEQAAIQEKIKNQNSIAELIGKGVKDPIDIFNSLGKKVEMDEIVAMTNTYKDQEIATDEAISLAISSGEATPEEIAAMNNTSLSFADRKTAAYKVLGRVQETDRALDRRYKNAQTANIYDQIDARRKALVKDAHELDKEEKVDMQNDAKKAIQVLTLVTQLKNHERLGMGTGTSSKLTFGFGGPLEDFNRTHDQVKNLLTLDNLGLMKGVLSETDVQILASAATKLDPGLETGKYLQELDTIQNNIINSEKFNKARSLRYVDDIDYAIALGLNNEEIAEASELGLITTDYSLSGYNQDSPQSYYGVH